MKQWVTSFIIIFANKCQVLIQNTENISEKKQNCGKEQEIFSIDLQFIIFSCLGMQGVQLFFRDLSENIEPKGGNRRVIQFKQP